MGPKTTSVTADGEPDAFVIEPGWFPERTPAGQTRLVVSVPTEQLSGVHAVLLRALAPPLGFLYRRKVDRLKPRPPGAPPRDFVALDLALDRVEQALQNARSLVYHDGRCEVWLRGALGEQLVLDEDGVLYAYPDDPAFRDALQGLGVPERDVETMAERDYPKRWFHAVNDQVERDLIHRLQLTEMAERRSQR